MDLLQVMERFPTQEACVEHLEKIRWDDKPYCSHCGSTSVGKRTESKIGRIGRCNCHECHASFKVPCGTIFHGTKIALQKWFVAIALIVNAKKSLSSHQLSRDLDLNQKTAWYILARIRSEMSKKGGALLQGIIEADETCIGGKPRKANKKKIVNLPNADAARIKRLLLVLWSVVVRLSHRWQRNLPVRQSLILSRKPSRLKIPN